MPQRPTQQSPDSLPLAPLLPLNEPTGRGAEEAMDVGLPSTGMSQHHCPRVLTCLEIAKQELASELQMWQGIDLPAYQHYWADKRELFYDKFDLQNMQMQCALVMT